MTRRDAGAEFCALCQVEISSTSYRARRGIARGLSSSLPLCCVHVHGIGGGSLRFERGRATLPTQRVRLVAHGAVAVIGAVAGDLETKSYSAWHVVDGAVSAQKHVSLHHHNTIPRIARRIGRVRLADKAEKPRRRKCRGDGAGGESVADPAGGTAESFFARGRSELVVRLAMDGTVEFVSMNSWSSGLAVRLAASGCAFGLVAGARRRPG